MVHLSNSCGRLFGRHIDSVVVFGDCQHGFNAAEVATLNVEQPTSVNNSTLCHHRSSLGYRRLGPLQPRWSAPSTSSCSLRSSLPSLGQVLLDRGGAYSSRGGTASFESSLGVHLRNRTARSWEYCHGGLEKCIPPDLNSIFSYSNRQSLPKDLLPNDLCKKSSNFDIMSFSKRSFPKKPSKVFPSSIVP